MINPAELKKGPQIKEKLPLLPDEVVTTTLHEQIEAFLKMRRPSFSGPPLKRDHELFTLEAGKERTILIDKRGKIIGEVTTTRLQELGLKVMGLYGLKPDKPASVDSLALADGSSTETSIYQSIGDEGLSIEDLKFIRQLRRDGAGQIISVSWYLRHWTP